MASTAPSLPVRACPVFVRSSLSHMCSACCADGQTASGKTFTTMGSSESPGVVLLAMGDVFAHIRSAHDRQFQIRVSAFECYNETVNDLLGSGRDLRVRVCAPGALVPGSDGAPAGAGDGHGCARGGGRCVGFHRRRRAHQGPVGAPRALAAGLRRRVAGGGAAPLGCSHVRARARAGARLAYAFLRSRARAAGRRTTAAAGRTPSCALCSRAGRRPATAVAAAVQWPHRRASARTFT